MVRYVHSGASSSDSDSDSEAIVLVAEQVTGATLLEKPLTPFVWLHCSVLEVKLLILESL